MWLLKEFKGKASYEVRDPTLREFQSHSHWEFLQQADSESGAGYWKVNAPRAITLVGSLFTLCSLRLADQKYYQVEQNELKKRPLKKRRTLEHWVEGRGTITLYSLLILIWDVIEWDWIIKI
jgi:hypothetical protein